MCAGRPLEAPVDLGYLWWRWNLANHAAPLRERDIAGATSSPNFCTLLPARQPQLNPPSKARYLTSIRKVITQNLM